jgi:hypothetical protein
LELTTEISTHGGLAKPTVASLAHCMKGDPGRRASAKEPAHTVEGKAAEKTSCAALSESK